MKTKQMKAVRDACVGALAMAVLIGAGLVTARAEDKQDRGQLSAKDYKFASGAAQGGMMEVTLGQLAAQKGSDQAVRDFGKRMQDDHQKADDELKELLTKKGAAYPEVMDKKDQRTMEHLNGLSGADFDKAYIHDMVSDHKQVVKAFQDEANSAEDPDLKMWVNKTLPTLQSHLDQAQSVEATVESQSKM